MSEHENELGDVRYFAMRVGEIVDRKDPLNLARVRVRVPGLCEPMSGWALPVGMPGAGSPQRGTKWVPPLHSEVTIFFNGGDPDDPRYMPAHWGTGEMPTDAKDLPPEEAVDVHCIEFKRYTIKIDERAGKEAFVLRDKVSGDFVEMDGVAPGVQIQCTTALIIKCDGIVSIDASRCVINGRLVSDGPQPI